MVNLQAIGALASERLLYGQETVARMKYLGKNKRAMYIVAGKADGLLDELELETQMGEICQAGAYQPVIINKRTPLWALWLTK